jgi:predicted DNA-binding transcriptional regulator AlpA
MSERFLSVEALAEWLDVPPKTIHTWRYKGKGPPAFRVGRFLRFDPDDVRAWLDRQRVDPEARR